MDEVDDSRTTLQFVQDVTLLFRSPLTSWDRYAVSELQRDVDRLIAELPESEREKNKTQFAIFVG